MGEERERKSEKWNKKGEGEGAGEHHLPVKAVCVVVATACARFIASARAQMEGAIDERVDQAVGHAEEEDGILQVIAQLSWNTQKEYSN